MRVILSPRAEWAVANDADAEENVWIASMMVRKSWVEILIYCGGDAEVQGPATSAGAVGLGVEGFEGAEDAEAVGNGAGTEDAGT